MRRSAIGTWVIALSSILGAALSLYNYLTPGTGIDHTPGAMLVIISSVLILLASFTLLLDLQRWFRGLLLILLLIGILGTGLAAYFLEASVLVALMVLALFGWFVRMLGGPSEGRYSHSPAHAKVA